MKQTTRRTLASILIGVSLLAACAPAPAATQDPAAVQQDIEPTSTEAVLPTDTQTPPEEASTPPPVPATESPFEPLPPDEGLPAPSDGESTEGEPEATDEPVATLVSVEELEARLSGVDAEFFDCIFTITSSTLEVESYTVERLPALDIGKETGKNEIIIVRPVNLRTGPTFENRILLTLRPDPGETRYTIIGGPAYTDLSADDPLAENEEQIVDIGSEYSPYSVSGRKYKWWQIQSPDQSRTGWIVEASACGLFRFIELAEN